jgi:hypothetical protein
MMQQQFFEQQRQQQPPYGATQETFAAPKTRLSFLRTVFYLLTALPLGVVYFALLVTAFSLGFGALAIWIGLPILYVTLLVWLRLVSFERSYTMHMLDIYIEPPSTSRLSGASLWQSLKMRMADPVTWKGLFYLLMKFPFGIFSFTLTVTLLTTSIVFILSPLAYLIGTLLVAVKSIPAGAIFNVGLYSVVLDGQFRVIPLLVFIVASVTGGALLYISTIILKFVANLWGEFARMTLGRRRVPQPMEAREFEGLPVD